MRGTQLKDQKPVTFLRAEFLKPSESGSVCAHRSLGGDDFGGRSRAGQLADTQKVEKRQIIKTTLVNTRMPPRVPRAALQQSYQCPSCTARRTFSRSAAALQIGPESPRYIDIPQPPQQTTPEKPRIRGALPVPRDIFAGSAPGRGLDKADPKNIAQSTKEPTKQRYVAGSPDESRLAWKERMAEQRRKNLREGLEALKERKVRTDTFLAAKGKRRQQEREALLHRPEREDERLTNPTIDLELQSLLNGAPVEDPDKAVRLMEKKQRVALMEAARKEDRADALHHLYINARNFITNESQLAKAIDTEFGSQDAPRVFDPNRADIPSVWAYGKPDTVQDMLNRASGRGGRGALASSTKGRSTSLTKERVTKIGEELTGGRTDPESQEPTSAPSLY